VTNALTAALLVDAVHAEHPVISPDGRWVAWTTSSTDGHERVSELWLAPVGE
jgi:Tol biopolymer transport system component